MAAVLEGLSVLAGSPGKAFAPRTPFRLRAARTCYDHMAGALGVWLCDRLVALEWLAANPHAADGACELTARGARAVETLGIDIAALRGLRRRFAFSCLDWSERRSHLGGALGAALLAHALKKRWVTQELESRELCVTSLGRRELRARFGPELPL